MAYDLNDTVPLGVDIRDLTGALVTPGTITLAITQPDGTLASPTVPTTTATGIYTFQFVTVQAGKHNVRWTTTSPNTGHPDSFDVSAAYPPLIINLAEAKAFLNLRDTDTARDEELRAMLEGITAVVEREVGPVVRRTVVRTIYPTTSDTLVLPETQIISLTSGAYVVGAAAVDLTGWASDYGILRTTSGATPAFPTTPWTLTYVVGRNPVTRNIIEGAKEILKEAWSSQRGGEPRPFLVSYRAQAWLDPDRVHVGFA